LATKAAFESVLNSKVTMEKADLVQHQNPPPQQPSKLQLVCDAVWLAVTTVILLVSFITSGLSSRTEFGFKNTTGDVSDIFFTQVCSNQTSN
jgi:anti-sigma factor RsiW